MYKILFKLFLNAVKVKQQFYFNHYKNIFFEFVVYCKVRGSCITVNVVGSGLGDPSSNPGQGCLHFT